MQRPASGQSSAASKPATSKPLSLAEAWNQARQAYATGKPGTLERYKQLIQRFPDVPDLPGELGNIYYQQGKLSEAAAQYYEAAMRLIRAGQGARAACLLAVLKRIAPAKAMALARQTNQACPAAAGRQ